MTADERIDEVARLMHDEARLYQAVYRGGPTMPAWDEISPPDRDTYLHVAAAVLRHLRPAERLPFLPPGGVDLAGIDDDTE